MSTSPGQSEDRQRLHPPFAQPDPGRRATPHMAAGAPAETESPDFLESAASPPSGDFALDSSEAMPSIERFVDDLPLIDEFLLQPDPQQELQADSANVTRSVSNHQAGRSIAKDGLPVTGNPTIGVGWLHSERPHPRRRKHTRRGLRRIGMRASMRQLTLYI